VLPVVRDGTPVGSLVIVGDHGDPFTALGEEFLRTLGRQVGAALQHADLTTRLAARTRQLERLSVRMARQHEEERRRISLELHDETAQAFAAVKLQLGVLRETVDPSLAPRMDRVLELVDTGIRMSFDAPTALPPLSNDAELALFRAVQEALSNVARHANATSVAITLSKEDAELRLEVRDDGRGFQGDPGLGLTGMSERLGALGGGIQIVNAAGGGARLAVRLPFEQVAG
jgi:signal transduction histidine kinase